MGILGLRYKGNPQSLRAIRSAGRKERWSKALLEGVSVMPGVLLMLTGLIPVREAGWIYLLLLVLEAAQLALWHVRLDLWEKASWFWHLTHLLGAVMLFFMRQNWRTVSMTGSVWVPAGILAAILLAGYLSLSLRARRRDCLTGWRTPLAAVLIAAYAFLWTAGANAALDNGASQPVTAKVVDMQVREGSKNVPDHWMKVSYREDGEAVYHEFNVHGSVYGRIELDSEIGLLRHPGAFGAAWYEVDGIHLAE